MERNFNQFFQPSSINNMVPDSHLQNLQAQLQSASAEQQTNQFILNRFGVQYSCQQSENLQETKNQLLQSKNNFTHNYDQMQNSIFPENINLQSLLNRHNIENNQHQQNCMHNNKIGNYNFMMQNGNNQISENLLSQLAYQQKQQLLQQQNLNFNLKNLNSNYSLSQKYNPKQMIDLNRDIQNQNKMIQTQQYTLDQYQNQQNLFSKPLQQQQHLFNNQYHLQNNMQKNINLNQQNNLPQYIQQQQQYQQYQQQINQNYNNQISSLNNLQQNQFINTNNNQNISQSLNSQNILQIQKQLLQEQEKMNILNNLNNTNNYSSTLFAAQLAEQVQKCQNFIRQLEQKLENSLRNQAQNMVEPSTFVKIENSIQNLSVSNCIPLNNQKNQVSFYTQQESQSKKIFKALNQQPANELILIFTKKENDQLEISKQELLSSSRSGVFRENKNDNESDQTENQLKAQDFQVLKTKIEEKEQSKDVIFENINPKNEFHLNENTIDQKDEINSQTIQDQSSTNVSNKNFSNEDAILEQEEIYLDKQSNSQSKNSQNPKHSLKKSKGKSKKSRSQKEFYLSTLKKQKSEQQNNGIRSAFAKRNGVQTQQTEDNKSQNEDTADKIQITQQQISQLNKNFEQEIEQQKYEEIMQKKKEMQNESNYTKNILKGFRRYFIKNFYNNKKLMNNFEKYYSINSLNNEFILKLLTVSPYVNYFKDFLQEDPEWWMEEAKISNKERQRQIFSLYQKKDINLIKTKRKNFNQKIIGKLEKSDVKEKQTCEDQLYQEENDVINSEITLNIQDLSGQREQTSDLNAEISEQI